MNLTAKGRGCRRNFHDIIYSNITVISKFCLVYCKIMNQYILMVYILTYFYRNN